MKENEEPNTNQTEGRIEQGVGEVKETAGEKSGDDQLRDEGKAEQVAGRAQEKLGDKQADNE
jgi:uncharacterized protein YjbJ (UPF0337 family)